jgi:fatty acid-binding protein DegV
LTGIRVVTDSACDLPPATAAELGIEIVPLTIRFGATELVDRQDLTPADFWARCAASPVLPETAAPSPGAFEQTFRRLAADGAEGIVCVSLSASLSATCQSARVAADTIAADARAADARAADARTPDTGAADAGPADARTADSGADAVPVRVVDSRSVSLAQGRIAMAAAQVAAQGKGLEDVAGAATDLVPITRLVAALDTLENLKKGGRIGGARAMLGSILSIKPIIRVVDGRVEEEAKTRTRARSLRYLADAVSAAGPLETLGVVHAEAPDTGTLLDLLGEVFPRDDILVGDVGAVIGTHVGRGAIGVTFVGRQQ